MGKITQVKKRSGELVSFDVSKISNAIWKAAQAVGGKNREMAHALGRQVETAILENFGDQTPTVEDVQDMVEKVLIEEGHARTVKAYITYRQKRSEIRADKLQVLEKESFDEVDKVFDINALRVLKARYLRKDESGKLIETPKQLFTRVATHGAIPSVLFDARIYDMKHKQKEQDETGLNEFDCVANENKLSIGKYKLNRYHLEGVKHVFQLFNEDRGMKVSWKTFLDMLKKGDLNNHESEIDGYYNIMTTRKFMPNTPAIANFGNPLGMGSACFVMDVEDNIQGIMETLKQTAIVFQAGGGMGYNFSKLRPEGDIVRSTSGTASGPLSFMSLYDKMTDVIKQGGIRRGANMGILNSNHPDIEKFITAKDGNKALRNFNISVLIMPDFWEHYENGTPYPLRNPRNGDIVRTVDPKMLFDRIVYQAWESAEPGVIFYDHVNKYNPFFEHLGPIVTTNPCGEVLLYPNESCNLGSVNVWAFYTEDEQGNPHYDWDGLAQTVMIATTFLDSVMDVNKFPLKVIEEMTRATRKVGLGLMGLADLLYELRLPYNSEAGRKFMEQMMEFINYYSKVASIEMAKTRGPMPYFNKSFYPDGRLPIAGFEDRTSWHFDWDDIVDQIKKYGIRNGYTTIVAPTGSISMIAGTTSGIEPVFSLVFEKNVSVGSFFYADTVFENVMRREGLYDQELMRTVNENRGTVQDIPYISNELKGVFVTAMDIRPEDHIRALAAFQRWTDSSISKTNNFPAEATVEDMRESYILGYKLGCKDVTVFRDGSIKDQVLNAPKKDTNKTAMPMHEAKPEAVAQHVAEVKSTPNKADVKKMPVAVKAVAINQPKTNFGQAQALASNPFENGFSKSTVKNCPTCTIALQVKEGCATCPSCGWGLCSSI